MFQQYQTIAGLLNLIIILMLSFGLNGCAGSPEVESDTSGKPVVTLVARPTGTRVSPGQQVAIAAEIQSYSEIQSIRWTAKDGGELSSNEGQSVIYTVPDVSGKYNVDVTVTNKNGSTYRTTTFEVVGTVTAVPTATATAKPLPTPTEETSVTINIPEATEKIECSEGSTCTFTITGRVSTEFVMNNTYKIVPFVNPSPGDSNMWLPQPEQDINSENWQAEVQIETDEGIDPDHHFEIVILIIDAETQIPAEFQSLPPSATRSTIEIFVITPDRKISWLDESIGVAVAAPTETPTLTPTESSSSTAIVTSTPLPPTPSCNQSLRIPLDSSVDFRGEIEISTPENCTTGLPTESPILVSGTYENIPTDIDIWALVFPPNLVYYVQSPEACQGAKMTWRNGQWQVPVYLGGRSGPPEWFDIVVVLADQEASQFLSNWVQTGCQTNNYRGILPEELEQMNITEKNSITVQTLD